ncbi:conjugative transposon protein TraM [Mucilaginibacter segetis]|uniref:Conjugative transposon protein TraM n=1 Tax=Mucilaginibacter segetis TaxID=2793071 RepID=A0A934PTG1_9SPHI|nr:conjugative transposon protein TraM [Mucilaginibacter segetis]MBK0379277.1 conjugative transposon protein TraM [Mucilaginibacter segetis]
MNKQRKFLLVLPLLVIPFLTMAFWALGGGQSPSLNEAATAGMDVSLPQAQFKKEPDATKMAVYQAARRDSAQNGVSSGFLSSVADKPAADQSADRIQAKLAQLNQQLAQPAPSRSLPPEDEARVRKLHDMAQSIQANREEDPQIAQLSHMLSQLQAMQHPVPAKTDTQAADASPFQAIPAVIAGKQKVMDGAAVKLRLTDSVTLKDQLLPKGQTLFGVCSVTNQRLLLTIQHIRLGKQIIPVSLTVFSLDGMPGIPAPEAELGGAAANGAGDAIQNLQFLSMDQSLGTQAAASGINAAKGLFSKKVKKIKVKLKDRYPVLLKINH